MISIWPLSSSTSCSILNYRQPLHVDSLSSLSFLNTVLSWFLLTFPRVLLPVFFSCFVYSPKARKFTSLDFVSNNMLINFRSVTAALISLLNSSLIFPTLIRQLHLKHSNTMSSHPNSLSSASLAHAIAQTTNLGLILNSLKCLDTHIQFVPQF